MIAAIRRLRRRLTLTRWILAAVTVLAPAAATVAVLVVVVAFYAGVLYAGVWVVIIAARHAGVAI